MYIASSTMYVGVMTVYSIAEARRHLAEVIERSATEEVILERRGEPAAVVISPERFEELQDAWEQVDDIRAYDEAMAESGPNIPWEQVRADLGWA